MKRLLFFSFLFLQFFCACNNNQEPSKPENDLDAARMFIKDALNGNYSAAKTLLLRDSVNTELLNAFEENYHNRMNPADKEGYRGASLTIYDSRQVNDSVTIINYSNSFKNKKDSLKVVRINGQWLVDLKYSFLQTDSVKNVH